MTVPRSMSSVPEWRNWQTRETQNRDSAIPVRFEILRKRLIRKEIRRNSSDADSDGSVAVFNPFLTNLVTSYNLSMPTQNTRDQIREAVETLPPDATFEDAIERLVFLAKIEAGLAELDAGKGVPHEEVKQHLGL